MPSKKKRNAEPAAQPPIRDKRVSGGARRFVRLIGHHFVLLGACQCTRSYDIGLGGACATCGGAVLTLAERAT